jgi:hypothetical protein
MKYLTLKSDDNLDKISELSDETIDTTTNYLLRRIGEIDGFFPDRSYAGEFVVEVLDSMSIDVRTFVRAIVPPKAYNYFSRLQFWGEECDCPDCGCLMELWDYATDDEGHDIGREFKCVNCGRKEIRNEE